jgi:hypothetical protein
VDLTSLNNDQVHAVAAHLAVAEAIRRARVPADIKAEDRRYRLRVNGKLTQVFSRRQGDWQITDGRHPLAPDTELVVLVDFVPRDPEFYVMTADWFTQDVTGRHAAFLADPNTKRRNPDSHHHNIRTDHVRDRRGSWDVVLAEEAGSAHS